jgi:hypothetical protein
MLMISLMIPGSNFLVVIYVIDDEFDLLAGRRRVAAVLYLLFGDASHLLDNLLKSRRLGTGLPE